jgi:hypothetical protein
MRKLLTAIVAAATVAALTATVGSGSNWWVLSPDSGAGDVSGATFGPATYDVDGPVALAQDPSDADGPNTTDACSPPLASVAGMIALADRGACPFTTKAKNAQDAGALGLLVVNDVEGPLALGAVVGAPAIAIPAVGITRALGAEIKAALDRGGANVVLRSRFRDRLVGLRSRIAALEPALQGNQAKVRLTTVLEFLDKALQDASWRPNGKLVVTDEGIYALRQLRMAVNYLRTPNEELDLASEQLQVGLIALAFVITETRYAEVAADPGASSNALARARQHLDNAAAQPESPNALVQLIAAWDVLDGQPPRP